MKDLKEIKATLLSKLKADTSHYLRQNISFTDGGLEDTLSKIVIIRDTYLASKDLIDRLYLSNDYPANKSSSSLPHITIATNLTDYLDYLKEYYKQTNLINAIGLAVNQSTLKARHIEVLADNNINKIQDILTVNCRDIVYKIGIARMLCSFYLPLTKHGFVFDSSWHKETLLRKSFDTYFNAVYNK